MTAPLSTWRIDVGLANYTLVFASVNYALPTVIYCGPKLASNARLDDFALADTRPITPGTLDQIAPLSLLPEEGRGFLGYSGIQLSDEAGRPALTQFKINSVDASENTIVFLATDNTLNLALKLTLGCKPGTGVLAVESEIENLSTTRWRLDWLSVPVLQVDQSFQVMQEYRGRWTQEFTPIKNNIRTGVHIRESRRARTGHDHFPGLIVGETPLCWTRGKAAAFHYAYSDVHRVALESMPDGRRQVQAGVAEARWLEEGAKAHSGNAYWTFSDNGMNDLAQYFQQFVRTQLINLPKPSTPRLVNYNCWEAIYFDHSLERLKTLANSAARVGAERFVLDDGWFGTKAIPRNDDSSTLGDWVVDTQKYPDGLTPLIEHVNGLGMKFGLWFEPEMVNLNSALAKQHPNWVLKHGDVEHVEGRQQFLLDFTNADVVEHIFQSINAVLDAHNIEYIKWDMNRDATRAVDVQGHRSLVRHSDAVQSLMAKIRLRHPNVEIESCASGGGRIDYRVLQNTHRVWISDSIDARVRWKMQNEAFVFLPPSVYGSHVGAEQAHTSARKQPMSFRALVAMTGHMGIESDMDELNDADLATLTRTIEWYKTHRDWMHTGRQYRLDPFEPTTIAQEFVAADQSQFLLFNGCMDVPIDETTAPLRLVGLDKNADYSVRLMNKEDIDPMATRIFPHPLMENESAIFSGEQLMLQGLVPPFLMPDSMCLFHGERISA